MLKPLDEYSDTELFYMLCEEKKIAERAFSEIFTRHSSKVYAFCRRFLGNKEEAQDLFQETFIKFHQSASKDRVMTNIPAFLLTIARNLCVNYRRKEKTTISFEEYMAHTEEGLEDKNELLELVKRSLELMPDEYREIFILREYDGLSYNEIAEMINMPLNTVKVKIHRAKQKMREILSPYLTEMAKFD